MQKVIFYTLLMVFLMTACVDREFLNQFDSKVPKTVSTSVSPSGSGKITISPTSPSYKTGEAITLTPEPSQHWVFQKWDGDVSGTEVPLSLTMDSNKSVVAVFVKKDYALTITIQGGGTISETIVSSSSGREYPHGTTVRLTPIPQQGWIFDSWGGDLSGTDSPKNITVDQEKNVTAKFIQPAIASISCATSTINGNLNAGSPAAGVNSEIPYTGGKGSAHNGQTVTSTGITGLTASLVPGTFANGNGSLTYLITGTPSGAGTASFSINIGNQTCTLSRIVDQVGSVSALNCDNSQAGTLTFGVPASGVSTTYSYSGGNGGPYNGQTIVSSTIPSLTATLLPGNFTNGNGTLIYNITGTPPVLGASGGVGDAIFEIAIGGKTCVLNIPVEPPPGSITTLNCSSVGNTGSLISGSGANGVSFSIPYTGGNGGVYDGQVVNSTGVTGLTATLTLGFFANGSGSLIYTITGTPSSSGTANFAINIGGKTCVISRTVNSASIGNSFTDPRDGNVYKIVQIGTQIWFSENLRYAGNIPEVTSTQAWAAIWNNGVNPTNQPAWAFYNNDPNNNAVYGKLYNWFAVNTGILCPPGWHIPTDADFVILKDFLGGNSVAGGKMKSVTSWGFPNVEATNESGFTGLPGGGRYVSGEYFNFGERGYWWVANPSGSDVAYFWTLNRSNGQIGRGGSYKGYAYSCRCLKD